MEKRKFALGYFYYNTLTGQYICEPTGVECDTLAECKAYVEKQKPPKNKFSDYNVSEFRVECGGDESAEYVASCNLQKALDDDATDLSDYKL